MSTCGWAPALTCCARSRAAGRSPSGTSSWTRPRLPLRTSPTFSSATPSPPSGDMTSRWAENPRELESGGEGAQRMLTTFVKVATVGELAVGEMRDASVDGEQILLARIGETYYAINNICSHFFTYLTGG